jgi:hypothetical protein
MTWTLMATVRQTATGFPIMVAGSKRHSEIANRHRSTSVGQGSCRSASFTRWMSVTRPEGIRLCFDAPCEDCQAGDEKRR